MEPTQREREEEVSVEELCVKWLGAKQAESEWNLRRIQIEEDIIKITGKRDEGSQTSDHGTYKVTVTGKVSRKMDWEKWKAIEGQIPVSLRPVKMKPELDEKGVKYLKDNEPEIYALLPIDVKPAKTAVEVKVAK